jgi:hypothetical protein
MVRTTVGEDVHEEGVVKDPGDSSRLLNGAAALKERGVSVSLTDKRHFATINEVYEGFVSEPHPARTVVYVGLPEGLKVEIDEIAVVDKSSGKTQPCLLKGT